MPSNALSQPLLVTTQQPQGIPVQKFAKDGKLFIRAFLLDARRNINGWKVTSSSLQQNIKTFLGAPLLLTSNYDHPPFLYDESLLANAQYQERFRVGTIVDIVQKDARYDAIIEITDPLARQAIENNDIPFFVSPRILADYTQGQDVSDWMGFHLEIVDKPAYGDIANFKGACYGAASECKMMLAKSASAKSTRKEDCGFCVKSAMEKLLTNLSASAYTSQFKSERNSHSEMGASETSTVTENLSGYVPKADFDALRVQFDAFKLAAEDGKKAYASELETIKEERRNEKISTILSGKIADKKVLEERRKYFLDAKVAPEVVEMAYKDMPDISTSVTIKASADNADKFKPQDASANSAGRWMESFANYERSIIKGASK